MYWIKVNMYWVEFSVQLNAYECICKYQGAIVDFPLSTANTIQNYMIVYECVIECVWISYDRWDSGQVR